MEENVNKNLFWGQKGNNREEVIKNFNFHDDLAKFIENEYPKHLKIVHERAVVSGSLNQAAIDGDLDALEKIRTVIDARINYLDEKSKDSDEEMKHVIKLKLLLQEVNNILGKKEN